MKTKLIVISIILFLVIYSFLSAQELELISTLELPEMYAYGIDVQDGYAYLSCGVYYENDSILKVIDVSNPYSPVLISTADTTFYERGQDIKVKNGYAYIADNWSGIQIFNIQSPQNPQPVCIVPTVYAHTICIRENLLYLANCARGLYIVDISNPNDPTIISQNGQYGYADAEAVDVAYPYAYIAMLSGDLSVIDISNPYQPVFISMYNGQPRYYDIKVDGNYAYTAKIVRVIEIFDISNPSEPILVTSMDLGSRPFGLFVYSEYLFVANGSYLKVLDITNPEIPEIVAQADDNLYVDVFVENGLVYTCGYSYFNIYSFNTTRIDEDEYSMPSHIQTLTNYPNPFNENTNIVYRLSAESFVELIIYDLLGREEISLVNEQKPAGDYTFNFSAADLPSGIYFYKLQAGDYAQTKKMVLLK